MHRKGEVFMLLDKKISLVTGAAQGIGEGIANLFAEEGSAVLLCNVNEGRVVETADRIHKLTGRVAEAYQLDVTDEIQVRTVVDAVHHAFGRIDVLVNCAGILEPAPFLKMNVESWDRHFAVNVRGAFLMSQSVASIMHGKGGCKIINISSDSGVVPFQNEAAYAASKVALLALTRAVAKELGVYAIYCNAICPGAVMTPMLERTHVTSDAKLKEYIDSTALKKIATPEDVARIALFFASHLSDHITGEHIMANAGDIMNQ
jgi:NAD(P)-dependent dehydrogenase (short-subunit alcohol dehydrogenase family)